MNVDEILDTPRDTYFNYTATVHTEFHDIEAIQVTSIDRVCNYMHSVGDFLKIEFQIGYGTYVYRLFKERANLELTITSYGSDSVAVSHRYKAVLNPTENAPGLAEDELFYSEEHLNLYRITDVKLDLIERALEPIRIKTVSGSYPHSTVDTVITSILMGEASKILIEGKPAVDGVDVVESPNKKLYQQIIIPDRIHVTALPSYLQTEVGGVYPSGIGTYLQRYKEKMLWFVYPLYDYTRFNSSRDRVIFYNIPEKRLSGVDRTYLTEGAVTKVLVTAEKMMLDHSDINVINDGVGFRMPDAGAYMTKPVEITEDGPVGVRSRLVNEVIHRERKDGLNYAPMESLGSMSNPFLSYSNVLERESSQLDLVWEYSDDTLIYPGMPCQYQYASGSKTIKVEGTIVFIHTATVRSARNAYIRKSKITITVGKNHPEFKESSLPQPEPLYVK